MGFSGNVSPVMRQKDKGTRPARNAARRAARRVILDGFPIAPRAFDTQEIKDYFGGDRITCLLCGKSYNRISAQHLHRIHSKTEDEYRKMFGLPFTRGLTSSRSHARYSAVGVAHQASGVLLPGSGAILAAAHEASRKQRKQPFTREIAIKNLGAHAQKS